MPRQPIASTKLGNSPKHPVGNNFGLHQAYDVRDFTAELIQALRADMLNQDGKLVIRRDEYGKPVDAPAIAQLAKAWSEACDRIRIMRNRPLPGSLKPEPKSKVKRQANYVLDVRPLSLPPPEQSK